MALQGQLLEQFVVFSTLLWYLFESLPAIHHCWVIDYAGNGRKLCYQSMILTYSKLRLTKTIAADRYYRQDGYFLPIQPTD